MYYGNNNFNKRKFFLLLLSFTFISFISTSFANDGSIIDKALTQSQIKDEYIIKIKNSNSISSGDNKSITSFSSSRIKVESFFKAVPLSVNGNKNFTSSTSSAEDASTIKPSTRKILHRFNKIQSLKNLMHVRLNENDLNEFKKSLQNDIDFIEPNYTVSYYDNTDTEIKRDDQNEEKFFIGEDDGPLANIPVENCNCDNSSEKNILEQKWNEFTDDIIKLDNSSEPQPNPDTNPANPSDSSNPSTPSDSNNNIVSDNIIIPKDQWSLKNINNNIDLGALQAWKISTGDKKIVVAVIDSGVDFNHDALKHAIWINKGEIANNNIDDDKNGYVDDVVGWNFANNTNNPTDGTGHGTHCAGIIAAKSNVAIGIAPNVSIMPLKFITPSGGGSLADAILSIEYAISMKANIINASWGSSDYSQSLRDAIEAAQDAGILFITAAGNDGRNVDFKKFYPACYLLNNIISVGSINKLGGLSSFSNFGVTNVDIAAPGSYILSSIPGNQYNYFSGTSMASPYVAGVAALILSVKPKLKWAELKDYLLNSSIKLDSLTNRVVTSGYVNAYKALSQLPANTDADTSTDPINPQPQPVVNPITTPNPPIIIDSPNHDNHDDNDSVYFDASKIKLNFTKRRLLIKLKEVWLSIEGDRNEMQKIKQVTYTLHNACRRPRLVTNAATNFAYRFQTYKTKQVVTYTLKLDNGETLTFTEAISI